MPLLTEIVVGARESPLSRAQVKEVYLGINHHHPQLTFDCIFVSTTGDLDQETSLKLMEKTDFFTREIDEMILGMQVRIGIHSAKDLPEQLPKGLEMIALTKGVDSRDSLILPPNQTLETLPPGSVIATSSVRREETISVLRPDLNFIDLRGSIHQRLAKLEHGEADGIVVAEAALIRLNLTHLNRIILDAPTAPLQGKLAVVARDDDHHMHKLFSCLDTRWS